MPVLTNYVPILTFQVPVFSHFCSAKWKMLSDIFYIREIGKKKKIPDICGVFFLLPQIKKQTNSLIFEKGLKDLVLF